MSRTEYTMAEWLAEGERRFGADQLKWKFVCPACGHIQAVEDFRPYKASGATAEDARFNCIGRFSGPKRRAFCDDGITGNGPCDYTSGGLFDIRPVVVTRENGEKVRAFDFALGPSPSLS